MITCMKADKQDVASGGAQHDARASQHIAGGGTAQHTAGGSTSPRTAAGGTAQHAAGGDTAQHTAGNGTSPHTAGGGPSRHTTGGGTSAGGAREGTMPSPLPAPAHRPGQILRWNFFIGGHLSTSVPVRLVERTPEGQLVWMETGTPMWRTALPRGTHLRDIAPHERPAGGYPVVAGRWPMGDALFYQPTGAAHSVLWLFGRGRRFRGWYVNLEHRVHRGDDIDIADHELDLTVAPDRTWRWKDEESFAEKTGHPAYWTAEQAVAIRAEGARVARLAEAGTFPFDGSWCDFRPPPAWRTPPRPLIPRHSLLHVPAQGS